MGLYVVLADSKLDSYLGDLGNLRGLQNGWLMNEAIKIIQPI